jgi:ethanolamine utilization cobalamin adenosyltransferase
VRVITEIELRDLYKIKPFETYCLGYLQKLTPAARQFLNERRIKIIEEGKPSERGYRAGSGKVEVKEPAEGYVILESGKTVREKPEEYTHIRGRMLVLKNNKRIKFRGMVDSLEAGLINTIIECRDAGRKNLSDDLTAIFEYVKRIMRAEVLDENLPFINFKGWTEKEIREYSQNPEKYFGIKHFIPDPKHGKVMAMLNILRTSVRELEIAGVDTFYNETEGVVERLDIILALNRLSSLIYIIMCQYSRGTYDN